MRLRIAAPVILLGWLVVFANAAGKSGRIEIWADRSGDDMIGEQVFAALKEKITASKKFELVGQHTAEQHPGSVGVHIVSESIREPAGKSGLRSAVSFALTFPARDHTELFVTSSVAVVGPEGVSDLADSILAQVGKVAESFEQ
ncbi:MAG TPA: hypothetical protein VMB26_12660 [Candidatus Binataceae bacterium]|nr:hypothetical protein [Candidatus Binataceae bacterium]